MKLQTLYTAKGISLSKLILNNAVLLFCVSNLFINDAVGVENSEKLQEITFLTGEWPPFSSGNIEGYGVMSEVVSEACKRAGIKPIFKFFPWKRSYKNVKEGIHAVTFPWLKTEERKKEVIYSDYPIGGAQTAVFYKKSDFPGGVEIDELKDLIPFNKKIAGVRGYWYENVFKETLGDDFLVVGQSSQAWKLLKIGRVGFVVDAIKVGLYESKKYAPEIIDDIAYATYKSKTYYNYLLFSPFHADTNWIKPKLDKALKSMHEDGTYKILFDKKK